VDSRHQLAIYDHLAGNVDKAIKHSIIAAGFGHPVSLKYEWRNITKGDYEKAL
jgi:hypothetical protein